MMTEDKPKNTTGRSKRMTDEQLAAGLEGLQKMNKEAMPKAKRDHLQTSIKSLKVLQQLRALQKEKEKGNN